jgi:inorganic pyrophosphatase
MKRLTVHIEWPTGSEDVDVELAGDETSEQIDEIAQETFYGVCNYGFSIDGEPQ